MSDYKELLERLKCNGKARMSCPSLIKYSICAACADAAELDAATAIETLLAERDALLDALRGSCGDCVFRETKKCEEPCIGCYHAPQHFCEPPSADSGLSECWQWRGTGGSDGQ